MHLRVYRPRELDPAEMLFVALIRRALKDARGKNERLRREACAWLWGMAPGIAERASLPSVGNDRVAEFHALK